MVSLIDEIFYMVHEIKLEGTYSGKNQNKNIEINFI